MPLTTRGKAVLRGLLSLPGDEQRQVIEELTRHARGDLPMKKSIDESLERAVSLGPVSGGCPCCGR